MSKQETKKETTRDELEAKLKKDVPELTTVKGYYVVSISAHNKNGARSSYDQKTFVAIEIDGDATLKEGLNGQDKLRLQNRCTARNEESYYKAKDYRKELSDKCKDLMIGYEGVLDEHPEKFTQFLPSLANKSRAAVSVSLDGRLEKSEKTYENLTNKVKAAK